MILGLSHLSNCIFLTNKTAFYIEMALGGQDWGTRERFHTAEKLNVQATAEKVEINWMMMGNYAKRGHDKNYYTHSLKKNNTLALDLVIHL